VISFTPRPLYSWGKSPRDPLHRRLGWPQSRSERREEKILDPTGTRTPTPRLSSSYSQSLYRLSYLEKLLETWSSVISALLTTLWSCSADWLAGLNLNIPFGTREGFSLTDFGPLCIHIYPYWTQLVRSRVRGSVTNNNGFWIGWLDLLTPLELQKLISFKQNTKNLILENLAASGDCMVYLCSHRPRCAMSPEINPALYLHVFSSAS
jgi:hypothetical protein